jgi:hypothetical protein
VRVYYTRLNKKIENGEHVVKGMEHNPDYWYAVWKCLRVLPMLGRNQEFCT